jgi:hypothetical protein
MRTLLLSAILIGMAPPTAAQRPRVPVPIYGGGGNDGYPACSTASIANLEPAGETLSVRAGPSTRERALAQLRNGDAVFACVRDGNWFGIVFAQPGQQMECGVQQEFPATAPYAGPCRSGWVYHRYIRDYADWISP